MRCVLKKKRGVGFCTGLLVEEIEKYVSGISEDSVPTRLLIIPAAPQMSEGTRHRNRGTHLF